VHIPSNIIPAVEGELLEFPSRGKIRAGFLSGIKGLVHDMGADPRDLLEQQEIDVQSLDDPDNELECVSVVNLLEHCSRVLKDPLFGLHLAERQEPDVSYGCVIALARSAPTFREGLKCLADYISLSTSPECEMEMLATRDLVELRWSTQIGMGNSGQTRYHGVLTMMKILQMLGRERFRPLYANLLSRISHSELLLLQEKLGCRIKSNSGINGIVFSADILDQPIVTSNKTLYTLLKNNFNQLRASANADFVGHVGTVVRRALTSGNCSLEVCADKLGTSIRTLQKRLARMGYRFSDIVQNERINVAKQTLVWTERSLDDLAFQLGYSEQTSFGRAFKRHTGMSPAAYRTRERQKQFS
jgi:AraC-like DNA-binding protein